MFNNSEVIESAYFFLVPLRTVHNVNVALGTLKQLLLVVEFVPSRQCLLQ